MYQAKSLSPVQPTEYACIVPKHSKVAELRTYPQLNEGGCEYVGGVCSCSSFYGQCEAHQRCLVACEAAGSMGTQKGKHAPVFLIASSHQFYL